MPSEKERLRAKLTEEDFERYQRLDASLPRPSWFHDSSEDDDSAISQADEEEKKGKFCGCC